MRGVRSIGLLWCFVMLLPGVTAAQGEAIPCAPKPTDMVVTYGTVVRCPTIEYGDSAAFRFDGRAGDRILALLTGESHCFRLERGDGTVLTSAPCVSPRLQFERLDTVLDRSGTYTLRVQGTLSFSVFQLSLELLEPFSPNARTLCPFCAMAGSIDPDVDIDLYRFDASVGDLLRVRVEQLSPSSDVCAQLVYGGDLRLTVSYANAHCLSTIEALVNQGKGVVTIMVKRRADFSSSSYHGGPYNITLECNGTCYSPSLECKIIPADARYTDGQEAVAEVRIANKGAGLLPVETKVWLERPGGAGDVSLVNVGTDGGQYLAAGYEQTTAVTLGTVGPSLGPGLYRIGCRLMDPLTAESMVESSYSFVIE